MAPPALDIDDSPSPIISRSPEGPIAVQYPSQTTKPKWRFDTLQVHSGLEKSPQHGQCTLPIYNTASFSFTSKQAEESAIFGFEEAPSFDKFLYSRIANPTVDGFEKRIAALENGRLALAFSSGGAAVVGTITSLASVGDNVVASSAIHSGSYRLFQTVLPQLGIEVRFCDMTQNLEEVAALVDEKTKFFFTESMGNPSFNVPDYEGLAAIAHSHSIPVVVDATLTAAGYFCQPGKWGADVLIHSATKWIGGHGTTLGGVVINVGTGEWQKNKEKFPRLHGIFPGVGHDHVNWYRSVGQDAHIMYLKQEYMRDCGPCLSPLSAQQLFIGVESLSVRCQRQSDNAMIMARWLQAHDRVAWVQYPGLENHPSHKLALKYFERGFGTVLNFAVKGGGREAQKLIDNFMLVSNTTNIGDSKTVVGHHWSTTHKEFNTAENGDMGVTEDLCRLSMGVEDVRDLIEDFEQAFQRTPSKFVL